ncbi:MAG: cobalamin biosynthesis protein CbiD [Lachnospiraceae bacterium]|nr:cobalamin biosynthesis protein CbiD [Lachnospiraceae bacterium]
MRHGFTTGSCAAAASKAAAFMLLFGTEKKNISIITPKGLTYSPEILDIKREDTKVSCSVIKDGGDDPDATSGAHVCSEVSIVSRSEEGVTVTIDGGCGVGRVTKPGLDQPVGNAAINHVPREMIEKEVKDVCQAADFHGELKVVISVPEGEEIAVKTFNPRLGIIGGISIIGTSGVVEPMSMQAILDTIKVELNQHKAQGYTCAAVSPGNYGLEYMKKAYNYDLDRSVKCSNFIGDTIDMAAELGFESMLLTGNIGKLVKVAGGIMNTHSKEGDCRMEIMASAALQEGVSPDVCLKVLDCVMTDEAIRLIDETGKKDAVMKRLMDKIMFFLRKRAGGRLEIECILYSSKYGELAKSEGADKWLTLLVQDQERLI